MKNGNLNTKSKLKNAVKFTLIILFLIISYFISAITSSVYQTNIKFLILLICFLAGVMIFFLIYGLLYLIAFIKISRKTKRFIREEISYNDRADEYFSSSNYKYKYDTKKTFTQNLSEVKKDVLIVVKDVATYYGSHDEDYYYLGYTVYDALNVFDGAIDLLDEKISPIFKFLRIEDKPLKTVEFALEKAINSHEEDCEKKPNLINKVGGKLVKVTTFIFRSKIESTITDVVKFVGCKAVEIYSKSGCDYAIKKSGGKSK